MRAFSRPCCSRHQAPLCLLLTTHRQKPVSTLDLGAASQENSPVWSVPRVSHPPCHGQEFPPFPFHTPLPGPGSPSPLPRPLLSEVRACLGMGKEERTKVEGRGESNPALSPSRCTALCPSPPTYFPQGHWGNPSSCHPGVRVGGEGV